MVARPITDCGLPIADARQPCRRLMQSIHGKIDAGGDDAAEISALPIDDIEGCGSTEIDHHQRSSILMMSRERIEKAVGADLFRCVHFDLEPPIQAGLGDDRLDVEPVAAEPAQMVAERRRDHRADDRAGDIGGFDADAFDQRFQPDAVFVRCALRLGGEPPGAAPFRAVMYRENNIGIAGIDHEQHAGVGLHEDPRRISPVEKRSIRFSTFNSNSPWGDRPA